MEVPSSLSWQLELKEERPALPLLEVVHLEKTVVLFAALRVATEEPDV